MNQTGSIAERRNTAVGDAMSKIRDIEKANGVNRDSLKEVREVLLGLAAKQELFAEADFPSASGDPLLYLLSEDEDDRFALYLSTGLPGRSSPPHNHTTWAVIVGIEGEEQNRIYERVDDGSEPGRGEVRMRDEFVVMKGTGICFMPNDIHSIHVVSEVPTRNFHMYGRSLEHLPERIQFDTEQGTYAVFPASPGIRK